MWTAVQVFSSTPGYDLPFSRFHQKDSRIGVDYCDGSPLRLLVSPRVASIAVKWTPRSPWPRLKDPNMETVHHFCIPTEKLFINLIVGIQFSEPSLPGLGNHADGGHTLHLMVFFTVRN